MYEDRKAQALETWHSLLIKPEIRMTAQEQYEELLRLAEEYLKQGFIDRDERKGLVSEATKRYARAVEGVGAAHNPTVS
jgi:lipopolysaccharide biosynthesis regulator YciM